MIITIYTSCTFNATGSKLGCYIAHHLGIPFLPRLKEGGVHATRVLIRMRVGNWVAARPSEAYAGGLSDT